MDPEFSRIEFEIGCRYGRRRRVHFLGREMISHVFLADPGHDSRGSKQTLYEVRGGYRVLDHNWSHWQGEEGENIDSLSSVLIQADLIERYPALAADAGIMKELDLDADPDALDGDDRD